MNTSQLLEMGIPKEYVSKIENRNINYDRVVKINSMNLAKEYAKLKRVVEKIGDHYCSIKEKGVSIVGVEQFGELRLVKKRSAASIKRLGYKNDEPKFKKGKIVFLIERKVTYFSGQEHIENILYVY